MMSMALEVIIISVKCQDDTTFGQLPLHHHHKPTVVDWHSAVQYFFDIYLDN